MQIWDVELVRQISLHSSVQRVVALGTLFALELQAEGSNAGYYLITFLSLSLLNVVFYEVLS